MENKVNDFTNSKRVTMTEALLSGVIGDEIRGRQG